MKHINTYYDFLNEKNILDNIKKTKWYDIFNTEVRDKRRAKIQELIENQILKKSFPKIDKKKTAIQITKGLMGYSGSIKMYSKNGENIFGYESDDFDTLTDSFTFFILKKEVVGLFNHQ